MAQLFLSYAREDRECAELFARELSARGWTVWWDRRIYVGHAFSEVIERELDDAKCVIVLWSRNAVTSEWVQTEAREAAQRKVMVPVRIEDIRLPLEFRRLHTADLFEWRTRFDGPALEDCLASIELLAPKDITTQPTVTLDTTRVRKSAEPPQTASAAGAQQDSTNVRPQGSSTPANTPNTSANVPQSPAGFWISQDGQKFYASDLTTLGRWVEESRVRGNSHVYDPSLQQWIPAYDVTGLRSAWQKKAVAMTAATPAAPAAAQYSPVSAATPSTPRKANPGRIIAFSIVGVLFLLVIIGVSVDSCPSRHSTTDTAATDTSMTTPATDTAASTDTMDTATTATDTMAADTMATGTTFTDTGTTAASTDTTTTTGPISISLNNECSKQISVAMIYKNSANQWMSMGWYTVEPKSVRTDLVKVYDPKVYYYAGAPDGTTWKGGEGESATVMSEVRDPKWEAVFGELTGEGVKTVPFFGRTVDAGQSAYTQYFTCP